MNSPKPFPQICLLIISLTLFGCTVVHAQGRFPNASNTRGELLAPLLGENGGRATMPGYIELEDGTPIVTMFFEAPGSRAGSDLIARYYDISDPRNPIERTFAFEQNGRNQGSGFAAHATIMGMSADGPAIGGTRPYTFQRDNSGNIVVRDSQWTFPMYMDTQVFGEGPNYANRGGMYPPFTTRQYWSYGETNYVDGFMKNGQVLASWDTIGETGVIGMPFIMGEWLIRASDQSDTGIAIYDLTRTLNSPGRAPDLIGLYPGGLGDSGGYWSEIWGEGNALYVINPNRNNGINILDISDPGSIQNIFNENPKAGLNGWEADPTYAYTRDHYAYVDKWEINLRNFRYDRVMDSMAHRIDVSQSSFPVGNILVTGGYDKRERNNGDGPRQGVAFWGLGAPDTTAPYVGYHRPRPNQLNYPVAAPISVIIAETLNMRTVINGSTVLVRPIASNGSRGAPIRAHIVITSGSRILQIAPENNLLSNTTYEVSFPSGGIEDAAGNGIVGYSFRFSTGSTLISGGSTPPSSPTPTPSPTPTHTPTPPISPTPTPTTTPSSTVTPTPTPTPPASTEQSFEVEVLPAPAGPGERVTLRVIGDRRDGDLFRFNFGDGSAASALSTSYQRRHTYTAQGHYRATVEIRPVSGGIQIKRVVITVQDEAASIPSKKSSPIIYDEARQKGFVVNPDNDSVTAFSFTGEIQEFSVGDGCDPQSLAKEGQLLWVTCFARDEVLALNESGTIQKKISLPYGSAPYGVIAHEGMIYLSLYGKGTLVSYDSETLKILTALPLGPTPRAMAYDIARRKFLVTRFISPDDHGEVYQAALLANKLQLGETIVLKEDRTSEDTRESGKGVPNYLAGITISPNGKTAWVLSKKDNSHRGLYLNGEDLNQENSVRSMAAIIDLDTGSELFEKRIDIDNADSPTSVSFSPLGDYAFVPIQGNNIVVVYDLLNGTERDLLRIGTGAAPQGITSVGDNFLLVQNFLDRTVSVLDLTRFLSGTSGNVSISTIRKLTSEKLSPQILTGKKVFYDAIGAGIDGDGVGFNRMSGEGYLSCATCHLDGGHDGRTWDFTGRGEGLRNTTDLRGRSGTGHGRVHWSANFDEIQDFENDIRNSFGGRGFMSDDHFVQTVETLGAKKAGLSIELDALAAYVSSLDKSSFPRSPYRNADGSLSDAAKRGKALFSTMDCVSCHGGSTFTDSSLEEAPLHDVGTIGTNSGLRLGQKLTGIDTPTLLGVFDSPPYLHNGQAHSLAEVFLELGETSYQAEFASKSGATGDLSRENAYGSREGGAVIIPAGESGGIRFSEVASSGNQNVRLTLRYSVSSTQTIILAINEIDQSINLEPSSISNLYPLGANWNEVSVIVNLLDGTNEIRLAASSNSAEILLDEIRLMPIAITEHSIVQSLNPSEQQDLLEFLKQLDGTPVNFESDTPQDSEDSDPTPPEEDHPGKFTGASKNDLFNFFRDTIDTLIILVKGSATKTVKSPKGDRNESKVEGINLLLLGEIKFATSEVISLLRITIREVQSTLSLTSREKNHLLKSLKALKRFRRRVTLLNKHSASMTNDRLVRKIKRLPKLLKSAKRGLPKLGKQTAGGQLRTDKRIKEWVVPPMKLNNI
ncbi:MAG: Ig-like domain-containing protein [Bdellovibrionales bacterium]|nr:Ig-like domain-containing protein [Bdellovibrionales bacterium]